MAQSHCGTSLPSASTQGRNDTRPAHTYISSHDADHERYKNKAGYSKKSVQCKDTMTPSYHTRAYHHTMLIT